MNELMVKDVMTHLVVTLRPQDSIVDAAKRLLLNRISGAPVVQDGRLIGVASEADLVRAFTSPTPRGSFGAPYPPLLLLLRGIHRPEARFSTVGDLMTKDVVTVGPTACITEAASLIDRYGVRRLPVVDDEGFVIGVVARSDLVRCLARSYEEQRAS